MKEITLAALLALAPAAAFAGHETPLVGEVERSECGYRVGGYEISGMDAGLYAGRRIELTGVARGCCGHCRAPRFFVQRFRLLSDDLRVRGTIAHRPPGRVYAGYAVAGRPFDPRAVRGAREVCGDTFEVTLQPGCDPAGTRYAVVAWTDGRGWTWDGCRWVRMPRFGAAGGYVYERGRWSDGCRALPGRDAVCVWIR